MTRTLLGLFIFLLLQQAALPQTDDSWVRFEPEGGGFSLMMPGKPVEQVSQDEKTTSHNFLAHLGKALYVGSFSDYAAPIKATEDEELQANRDNFNKGMKATLINSRNITAAGLQGIEFTSETEGATIRAKVFLKGQRVFMIVAMVPKDVDQTKSIQRFIDSLTFNEK
jgi:hypothetical protein